MGSRTWIKVYVDKWLEGTISEESISVRGVWISLLALAGNGKYGDSGEIKALDGVGFTDQQLTLMLKVNPKMWGIARKRLLSTDRIVVNNGNVITIINWNKYQSEYERTSKYRINATTSDTPNDTPRDKRVESIEERVENRDTSTPSFITYKEKLRTTFTELDIDEEWERCQIWYRDHHKLIKSPSLALGNWCGKERDIKAKKNQNSPGKKTRKDYSQQKFGDMVQR